MVRATVERVALNRELSMHETRTAESAKRLREAGDEVTAPAATTLGAGVEALGVGARAWLGK